jgi:hypothetical protein
MEGPWERMMYKIIRLPCEVGAPEQTKLCS